MKLIGFYQGKNIKKKRRRRRNYRPLLVIFILLLCLGLICLLVAQLLKPNIVSDAGLLYIGDNIPVHEDFIPAEALGRVLQKREIKYIVIHETANTSAGADAAAHNSFIHQNSMTAEHSWHYTVDDEQIYHHVPDDEPAYHAGDHMDRNGGNLNGIGVELCVASDNNFEKTLDHAAQLSATLLIEYDLDPDKAMKKHEDFSGKLCPQNLIEQGRWEEFRKLVQQYHQQFSQN